MIGATSRCLGLSMLLLMVGKGAHLVRADDFDVGFANPMHKIMIQGEHESF